jgi:ABC-type transporter Mla subunit MlaD
VSRLSPFAVGLLALVVIAAGCYLGFTKSNPFADRFEFSAAFLSANDLKVKSPVRIAGVNVGKVTKVEPVKAGGPDGAGAVVTMEIEDKGLPLHEDARLKIRPRIFLEGNWFVELQPGSPSAPRLEDGARIPAQQTAKPVQFGELLNALQSDTRQDLRVVLDEYGRALSDGGARGYNRSIRWWEPAFRDSAIVNEATLGLEPHDLSGYIAGADRFARGLNRSPEQLKALVTDLARTAEAFASEDRNLTAAIAELPRTLSAGRSALADLNAAFPPFRRLIADLRPAVRSSGPALDATLPALKQLRGLVSRRELRGLVGELRTTVPHLAELNVEGVDLQKELRLLSSCSNEVIVPWRNDTIQDPNFPASGPVYQEQVKWLPGIAGESRSFDANGQYVRSLANGASYAYAAGPGRFFVTGLPLQGVNPPKAEKQPPFSGDTPCETQAQPDLRTNVQAAPKPVEPDYTLPAVQAAVEEAQERATEWLREELDQVGVELPVGETPLEPSQLPLLDKAVAP